MSSSPLPVWGPSALPGSSGSAPVPLRQEQPAPGHAPARPPTRHLHCGPDLPLLLPHPNTPATLTTRQQHRQLCELAGTPSLQGRRGSGGCMPPLRPAWPSLDPAGGQASPGLPPRCPLSEEHLGTAAPAAPAPRAPLLALHVLSSPTGLCLCLSWPRGVGVALLLPPPPRGSTWLTHSSAHQGADLGGQGASSSREPRG